MIKKLLTTSFVAAACFSASAQITLMGSDLGYVGDQVQQAVDTVPSGIVPGPAGANQTWNFSSIQQHFVETITFSNPTWNANYQDFPGATVAVVDGDGFVSYINNSGTSATALGMAGDIIGNGNPVSAKNIPAEIMMNWPATYGSNFQQNFRTKGTTYLGMQDPTTGLTIDSVRLRSNVTKYDTIDAWGALTTPLSTYNTLRIKEFRRQYDSIDVYITPFGWQPYLQSLDSSLTYTWWAKNMDFMIVQLEMDIPNNAVSRATWMKANPSQTGITEIGTSEVSAYPNPAHDDITITINATNAAVICIYDVTGKKLETVDVTSNTVKIDLASLSAGTYFYSVMDKSGALLGRSTFTVSK